MKRPPNPGNGRDRGGWRAFAQGMAVMFALIAIWLALVERDGDHAVNPVLPVSRPMTEADLPEKAGAGPPTSDYR